MILVYQFKEKKQSKNATKKQAILLVFVYET